MRLGASSSANAGSSSQSRRYVATTLRRFSLIGNLPRSAVLPGALVTQNEASGISGTEQT